MGIGWGLGDQYQRVASAVEADPRVGFGIVLAAVVMVGTLVGFRLRRRLFRRLRRREPEDDGSPPPPA